MGRKLNFNIYVDRIASDSGLSLSGENISIENVSSLSSAVTGSLVFAKNEHWASKAPSGVCLICKPGYAGPGISSLTSINPRLDFAKIIAYLDETVGFLWSTAPPEIHESVKIGRNSILMNGVRVGEGTVIGHNVVIGPEVKIGRFCNIKSGSVIGEEGFGFERDETGEAVRLPHIGNVLIGDNVEIGSLSTVCRGTLENTIIGDGCKIDDHVHIAHNVTIGLHAFVIACAEVSGGVRIGARAWIAPNASILNQISIGDDATVGLGAVVIKNVAHNDTVAGNPAKSLNKHGV